MNSHIVKYFSYLPQQTLDKLHQLDKHYRFWNEKINLISRKDIDNFMTHHVLHSISIAKIISFKADSCILDVGTGGGFPGIPLAILFPEVNFTLLDSIRKKIMVVEEVSSELGLKNVTTLWSRAEDINNKYDFVISRAVTALPIFVKWVKNNIEPHSKNELQNGILALKGGDLSNELSNFNDYHIFELKDYFEEKYFAEKKLVYLPL